MGALPLSRLVQPESLASVSPWQTSVRIDNQTDAPVLVHLAASAAEPSPATSSQHVIQPKTEQAICSGWYQEPRATLLIRTGLDEAELFRVPDGSRLIIQLRGQARGLSVEVPVEVIREAYPNAPTVPGLDTVPMTLRGVSFEQVQPESASGLHVLGPADPALEAAEAGVEEADI
eukprot:TRINITY_DN7731_c0_g2_i1.p2 TRINITY_DN7731_c0_g2~~TRINITY_DN7731_c0_g2_i1.p2  ORF type:complete len:175 (-),score=32.30 TRINITY_DN7731_c0_g2_i1:166-690(-)